MTAHGVPATRGAERTVPDALERRRSRMPPATVFALTGVALASGFGQFGAVAALGDVARSFGHAGGTATLAEQAGLSATVLGLGLAVLRLASLLGLPLAALADRWGRRPVLLGCCAIGLIATACAAASPSYWSFVAIFAIGRPFLSATNAVVQVSAAEHTRATSRATGQALVSAGYGIGAGAAALLHNLSRHGLGFRGLFLLALVPLAALLYLRRYIVETPLYARAAATPHRWWVGRIGRELRPRFIRIAVLLFAVSFVTGPANSFFYLYAENIEHLSGGATSLLILAAAGTGLIGLLVGRSLADRIGRRWTAAIAFEALIGFSVLAYAGSHLDLAIGYLLGILAASAFGPALGAFVNELFPTAVRGTVSGWEVLIGVCGAFAGLVTFGAVAEVGQHFAFGALATFLPAIPVCLIFFALPETVGRELSE